MIQKTGDMWLLHMVLQYDYKFRDNAYIYKQNKFKIKDSEHELPRLQGFVTHALQRFYQYWKSRLHTYNKECGSTHEERLDNPHEDFPIENWRRCCATFDSDDFKTKKNNNVKPPVDVIWLAEHTHTDDGVLVWVDDKRSKQVHVSIVFKCSLTCKSSNYINDLHDLVQNKDKEGTTQTQEEMLLQVLGPKSGYTRGKGSGYGGSIKARINEEQQQKIHEQQK
ncbi:hypothetical protein Cgig2_004248 [Carnegiea gigantea]|uniref:Uncharacterized protein n=1 Tax=Carnegiea gigantea TaxID=171969 RepID=A0A9Q1KHP6_9CARY|nr:hypothetical protein Cgig2_004248 [Carnegiea gigantea]